MYATNLNNLTKTRYIALTQINAGFTLIEILVVLGMMAVFTSVGVVFSLNSYQQHLFLSEYNLTTNLLAKVRNHAQNNFEQSSHSLLILDNEYRIFATNQYSPQDSSTYESYPRNPNVDYLGPEEITFAQLSGNLLTCADFDPCTYTLSYTLQTRAVTINDMGGIIW
jgi:prepilin-type N-terminal cleavage/methylation domain-containing protein